MKYHYNQKVKIKNGFFKGFKGKITKYTEEKTINMHGFREIVYSIDLKMRDGTIRNENINEKDIKIAWF